MCRLQKEKNNPLLWKAEWKLGICKQADGATTDLKQQLQREKVVINGQKYQQAARLQGKVPERF